MTFYNLLIIIIIISSSHIIFLLSVFVMMFRLPHSAIQTIMLEQTV